MRLFSALMKNNKIELPTLALIGGMWAFFGLITYFHHMLAWPLVALCGALCVTLFNSVCHEVLHGHPTKHRRLNEAFVFVPMSLWFPYQRYRTLHLIHHRNDYLTDPHEDPESYYLDPEAHDGMARPLQWLLHMNNSLVGRFILGPGIAVVRFWRDDFGLILKGDREIISAWVQHGLGGMMLFYWLIVICDLHPLFYVALVAYPGNSLAMLRSFAEHRAHEQASCRTIVVESGPIMSFLFLNNNLHIAHHEAPPLAWYKIPAYYRQHRARLLNENCGYLIQGYWQIVKAWAFKPKEPVAHPLMDSLPKR